MGVSSKVVVHYRLMAIVVVIVFAIPFPAVEAQSIAPSPALTSDGTSVDQGIAYVLMMLALALTYIMHAADF